MPKYTYVCKYASLRIYFLHCSSLPGGYNLFHVQLLYGKIYLVFPLTVVNELFLLLLLLLLLLLVQVQHLGDLRRVGLRAVERVPVQGAV